MSARDLMEAGDRMTVSGLDDGILLFFIGLLVSISVALAFRLVQTHGPKTKYARILDSAGRAGRKCTGQLVRRKLCRHVKRLHGRNDKKYERFLVWAGWYEYEVNGRVYKAKFEFAERMPGAVPSEIDIYYESH